VAAPTDGLSDNFSDADRTVSTGAHKSEIGSSFRPGMVIDQSYRLNKVIGQGAMGVVYSCTHLVLQKNYALKFLLANELSSEAWNRFQIEAKALAKLNHRGIVGIHNMGVHHGSTVGENAGGDTPYYVMDLLSGENLDDLLKKSGPLTVSQALDYFIQVADALHSAHVQGIIHRDIKPTNLMLLRDQNGFVTQIKVVDFGIARVNRSGHGNQSQTATGLVFGTPYYMSPEQCRGERVDQRADIYSLGCTLFEALTGEPPFKGNNAFQTFMMHQGDAVPTLESRRAESRNAEDFPDSLEAVIAKTLQKNASDRYQSMQQLKHDLERVKQGKDVSTKGLRTSEIGDEGEQDPEEEKPSLLSNPKIWMGLAVVGSLVVIGLVVNVLWKPTATKAPDSTKSVTVPDIPNKVPASPKDNHKADSKVSTKTSLGTSPGASSDDVSNTPISSVLQENVLDRASLFMNDNIASPADLDRVGASQAEKTLFKNFSWADQTTIESTYKKRLAALIEKSAHPGAPPPITKVKGAFYFPKDIYLGAIQIDNGPIQFAVGKIVVGEAKAGERQKDVHFYVNGHTEKDPQLLRGFGPDDLTGLSLKTDYPIKVVEIVRRWHRLKDLCFFNSLIKALPRYEGRYEESLVSDSFLPILNSFEGLRSLGLCGHDVSGGEIVKMSLLKKLRSIKVKSISDVYSLLRALPDFDNIEEVWLLSVDLKDKDLEPLTRMKNLKSLRITRCQLTPASLSYFQRMPKLRKLMLDRNWTDGEKQRFRRAIHGCEFEPVFDRRYWRGFP
jgi:serine/threonine protein kinase